jgi:hypothetical protein
MPRPFNISKNFSFLRHGTGVWVRERRHWDIRYVSVVTLSQDCPIYPTIQLNA